MVIWIIGLSGSGKTTLANAIVNRKRKNNGKVVLIDGDVIREIFGNDLGHSMYDRRINAQRICQLCKLLDDQNIDVVCAILSLFPESRKWNRKNLKNYYEVFLDTPLEDVIERDPKGIYQRFKDGKVKNVVGMDIDFPRPKNANLVIKNNKSREDLLKYADILSDKLLS